MPKMNLHRAQELIVPLRKGTAKDLSPAWRARLIEALEYVIERENADAALCAICGNPEYCHSPKGHDFRREKPLRGMVWQNDEELPTGV